jgi:hypothetical protein
MALETKGIFEMDSTGKSARSQAASGQPGRGERTVALDASRLGLSRSGQSRGAKIGDVKMVNPALGKGADRDAGSE